jgi:hypothetical protein
LKLELWSPDWNTSASPKLKPQLFASSHAAAMISAAVNTPLERARAKLEQIERELKKSPDFQLYMIAKTQHDRARMRRVLMKIPLFRLWRILTNSVKRARRCAQTPSEFVIPARDAQ